MGEVYSALVQMDYPYLILIKLNEASHRGAAVNLKTLPQAMSTVASFVRAVKSLALVLAPQLLGRKFVESVLEELNDAEYVLGYLIPGYAPANDEVANILKKWKVAVKLPPNKKYAGVPHYLAALVLAEDALRKIVEKLEQVELLVRRVSKTAGFITIKGKKSSGVSVGRTPQKTSIIG